MGEAFLPPVMLLNMYTQPIHIKWSVCYTDALLSDVLKYQLLKVECFKVELKKTSLYVTQTL